LYVLDPRGAFWGSSLRKRCANAWKAAPDSPIEQAFIKNGKAVNINDSMQDILPLVASNSWPVPVVDDDNVYKGVVSKNRFLKTLHRAEENHR
jgi:glycine betaine/proline transport system ATP-binding protein